MDTKQAQELKNIISGLLISTPLKMTIQQLSKDYRDMEGRNFPFQELGFVSLEHYLRSIPETVNVYGSGPFAELEVVVTSKSEHINSMVLKQKKSKAITHKGPFTKKYTKMPSYNHHYAKTKPPPNFQRKTPVNKEEYGTLGNDQAVKGSMFHIETMVDVQSDETIQKCKLTLELNNECDIQEETSSTSDMQKDIDSSKSENNESLHSKTNPHYSDNKNNNESIFTYDDKACSSMETNYPAPYEQFEYKNFTREVKPLKCNYIERHSSEGRMCRIPEKVQTNLQNLMQQFPNGIECTKLPLEYRKMFKRKLCYDDYGYKSLIEMCSDLPDIIYFVQQSSHEYMLYDKTKPLPVLSEKVPSTKRVQIETVVKTHILEELPKLDKATYAALIPSDVFNMSDEISRLFPSDVVVGDLLEISIGEIYDLSKFWIYMTFGELDSLMKELQDFFVLNHKRYQIPELLIEEGLYCVALYSSQYHRCVVVNLLPNVPHFVRVFFIDYGTVSNVHTDEIWFLPKQFGELPCQAIRARLSNIYPVYENRPWCAEAVARFEQLIAHSAVVGEVTKIDEQDHVLEIYLADITDKNNIFYINDVLVKEEYALYTDQERKKSPLVDHDCLPNVRYIHLFPEFYEIEAGLAPTTDEMAYINANKVPLSHFMPQYFDIHYYEDINGIQLQHEKFNQTRIVETTIPAVEPDEFDFDFFPDCIRDEIRELYVQENGDKSKMSQLRSNDNKTRDDNGDKLKISKSKTVESQSGDYSESEANVKEYFCNKKRISELIRGGTSKTDVTVSEASSDSSDLFSLKSSESPSHLERSQDVPLNNSFERLSLNSCDFRARNEFTSQVCTNPFLSPSYSPGNTNTNPFRATNPFLSDIEETINKSDLLNLFSKSSEDCLSQKIVNNLKDSNTCKCKVNKQNNIDKSTTRCNWEVSTVSSETVSSPTNSNDSFASSEKKELVPVIEATRRVRTPPGFSSTSLPNRPPLESTYNNSYNYPRNSFPSGSFNPNLPFAPFSGNFFPQNQLYMSMFQPFMNGYFNSIPQFYPNQNNFNLNWQQPFTPPKNFPPSKDKF